MSELWQVKASAGAGKTYQLTRRFLALLDNSDESAAPFVCANRPGKGFAWPEIMAVTFTNKAAAEMKERVVSGLKGIAMGAGDHADVCSPEMAHRTLNAILRRYHRLNIRTIDSLLALLLRLFALDQDNAHVVARAPCGSSGSSGSSALRRTPVQRGRRPPVHPPACAGSQST